MKCTIFLLPPKEVVMSVIYLVPGKAFYDPNFYALWINADVTNIYLATDPMILSENIVGNGKIIVSDPSWHWNHVDFTNAQVPQKCGWCESCILPLVAMLKSIVCVAPERIVNVKNPWDRQNLQWSSVKNAILGHVELHVLRYVMMRYI